DLNSVLRDSFEASRYWKYPGVLAPLAGYERDGVFEIVFRYLHPERRVPLTREIFRRYADQIVPRLFNAVEFIHLAGFVHCDLTPENIFLEFRDGNVSLIVSDLDLIRPVGAKPKGKIFGTQPYIAPEILEDEIIVARSDHYSLGIILAQLAGSDEHLREKLAVNHAASETILAGLHCEPDLAWLSPIVAALTRKRYQLRPFSLVRTLAEHRSDLCGPASEAELFWHDLRSSYRRTIGMTSASRFNPTLFLKTNPRFFGVPGEVLDMLQSKIHDRPFTAVRFARLLITSSGFVRNGDRWSLKISLDAAKKLIALLKPVTVVPGQGMNAKKFLRHGLQLARQGKPLAAAIWLESALSPDSPHYQPSRANAISMRLAILYRRAGFLAAAEEILKTLLAAANLPLRKRLAVLHGLVDAFQFRSMRTEQWKMLGEAYGLARKINSVFWRMKAIDKMLWSRYIAGRVASTYELAKKVDRFPGSIVSTRSRGNAANTRGSLEAGLCLYPQAEKSYRRSLEIMSQLGDAALYSVRGNLVSILMECGSYRECIAFARQSANSREILSDPRRKMQIDLSAITAYSFIGDIASAEQLASRYTSAAQMRGDVGALAWLTLDLGRIYMRCGRLDEARANLESAAAYYSDSGNHSFFARACLYLGILNAWRGNIEIARDFNNKARAIFLETNGRVWQLDSEQLDVQIGLEITGKIDVATARQIVNEYLASHHPLGALLTMAQLLLAGEFRTVETLLKESTEAMNYARNSGAVIGKAVLLHLKALKAAAKSTDSPDLALLRETLIFYRKIGFFYHAALVAKSLAEEYLRLNKAQLARGFLVEYHRLVTVVGNRDRVTAAKAQLEGLNESLSAHSARYVAILEVSRLLNSFEDFDVAANNLLGFALEQTGAERAALLLATDAGSDLRVESFIACDKVSLEDILTMSRSVMNSVFESNQPMIINDALHNEITREYRSVIKHNIYAIACVPLVSGKDVIGVLYLDHHSLPSVFSADEHKLIEAVANFIAVVLAQARQFDMSQRKTKELSAVHEALGLGAKFITRNKHLIGMIEKLPRVADSKATILLLGESGAGKDVLAKIIHHNSPYREGPLVTLNCSQYDGKIAESELFGIEKGMATGVDKTVGKIQLADGGSLFLDEVGELTLSMQAKLLRVLEEKEVSPIGGKNRKVDFRLIAATNRNLAEMMEQGTFRKDLFYRISTISIQVTPLRERPEDIEPLVDHFMNIYAPVNPPKFTRAAWRIINEYPWPGNVRQLKNTMERLAILYPGAQIGESLLPPEICATTPKVKAVPLRDQTEQSEKALIAQTLTEFGWNQAEAARKLRLPYSTLQRKIKKYGIKSVGKKNLAALDEKKHIAQTLVNCRWNLERAASSLGLKLSVLKRKIKSYKIRKRTNA
ncbi:MAG: sigma 54-interacting transcriptional regulator, partial [Candidatus Zixiibacteriota bacterium]